MTPLDGTTCRRPSSCPSGWSTTRAGSIPGQFAGLMGPRRDPWFIEASPFDPTAYGAYPEYEFDHQERPVDADGARRSRSPSLTLPEGLDRHAARRAGSTCSTSSIAQRARPRTRAAAGRFDRHRQAAVSLLTDPQVRRAFDVDGRRRRDCSTATAATPSAGRC